MLPPSISNILSDIDEDLASANRLRQDAESYVLHAKASAHDLLVQALRLSIGAANHARNALFVSHLSDPRTTVSPTTAPAFSPEALAAMEELDATTKLAQPTIDPLAPVEVVPAAQPNPTPAADPLDAPRSRGRRRRGETVGAPATPTEATPAPERDALPNALPEPDALDLPGEPVGDDVVVAAPAPEVATDVALPASLDDIFGSPPAEYDPLGD